MAVRIRTNEERAEAVLRYFPSSFNSTAIVVPLPWTKALTSWSCIKTESVPGAPTFQVIVGQLGRAKGARRL
jgi:hypothetical protein